jgi:hypothetical protein
VDDKPKPCRLVRLQLNEVVSTPDSRELGSPGTAPESLQSCIAQRCPRQGLGQWDGFSPVASTCRYRAAKTRKDAGGSSRFSNSPRLDIEWHCKHSTADVPADGLRVHEARGSNGDANTNVLGQVHIGHNGDVLHVRGAAEASDCTGHIIAHG